ncbi:YslB family protein [Halobacillus litoralis]|uniref:YslB family protein n=1 Tax=Halobacillus litoralis TaxID=45668 RepID=UPI001CD608E5|nr:YslB family protein [Halobacillus litoralis]MCA0969881.1 YslB family protein [Halobacillus litoralis]
MNAANKLTTENISSLVGTGAGFDILRYYTLPDFLGKDAPYLLYLMGKNIARQTELHQLEDLYEFFQYMGWGDLSLIKEKKSEMIFHLSGHLIEKRLQQSLYQVDFKLESGFLAETLGQTTGDTYECFEEANKKEHYIELKAIKA